MRGRYEDTGAYQKIGILFHNKIVSLCLLKKMCSLIFCQISETLWRVLFIKHDHARGR